MAKKPSEGKFIYHITHIDNLPSIEQSGLLPRDKISLNSFTDIANKDILSKRMLDGENLSDYVLFHFYAKNPFDYGICHKYDSSNLVILALDRTYAKSNNFKIIPSHPLSNHISKIFNYDEGFDKIEWDILDDIENRDYNNNSIRSACMAECLSKDALPLDTFNYIYVKTEDTKNLLLDSLKDSNIQSKIVVNKYMFL